jgi:hypothetical protein
MDYQRFGNSEMVNSIEFRNNEDEIVFETNDSVFLNNIKDGAKIKFGDEIYEVISSILITEKRAFWWSFWIPFDSPKMLIYIDLVETLGPR